MDSDRKYVQRSSRRGSGGEEGEELYCRNLTCRAKKYEKKGNFEKHLFANSACMQVYKNQGLILSVGGDGNYIFDLSTSTHATHSQKAPPPSCPPAASPPERTLKRKPTLPWNGNVETKKTYNKKSGSIQVALGLSQFYDTGKVLVHLLGRVQIKSVYSAGNRGATIPLLFVPAIMGLVRVIF